MVKITVLDGYSLNPGDLSWSRLEKLGDLTVYDYTKPEQVISRAEGAQVILTNKIVFDRTAFAQLPDLKYIGVLATGYNVIDVAAANARKIVVTNIPAYSTFSVAQMVFALLLEWCHRVQRHSDQVKDGVWARNRDFCFWQSPLIELKDKTIGIIGYGQIGRQVARIAHTFGLNVLFTSRSQPAVLANADDRQVDLTELLSRSDIVSLHCPLTDQTAGLIDRSRLALMKPTAFLINTARGAILNEQDVALALKQGVIAGAGLDVLSSEPPAADNPLLSAPNCLITPHIAWATIEARTRLMQIATDNVASFLAGQPVNIVGVS